MDEVQPQVDSLGDLVFIDPRPPNRPATPAGQTVFAGLNVVTMFLLVFAFQKMARLDSPGVRICLATPSVPCN